MPETRKYTVVDLFAGVGGLSYGFSRNEHYEIILANEMQKDIAKAYTLNHPAVNMLQGDIKDLSEDVLRQTIGNRTVDVVVGGPPCQSYSTLGKRQMDARANLFMEYKRVLCILHPRAFLFENVKGILSMDKGALFEHVRKEFENIGYSLQYKILNAVDYGVPQLRERVILVGFLGDNPFQYPEPTHGEGLLPYVTLQDALKDLPALSCAMKSTYPFVRLLNLRSFAPMSGKGISVPCALQMASRPSTPLRIWKVTTSFLGARADIQPTITCRCCARSAMRRSRICNGGSIS